ncbi:glycosyltransferase [Algibacter sp.]|uniref:glycosyltransferase n=1 Tax=Algibacter sp. TaxID=1872428 RepID=UPI003C77F009
MKRKICIVCTSLEHGGAERASAIQSKIFKNLGFDVFIVTVKSGIAYEYEGEVFDLGIYKNEKNSAVSRMYRLYKLKLYLNKMKFDFIIDNRPRNQAYREFIITKFLYKDPVIYVIHSYEESLAFNKYKWLNRFLYKNERMICVSKKGTEKFKQMFNLNNISTIYNAFDFNEIIGESNKTMPSLGFNNYIIYYGRIHNKSKNLKLLIDSYNESELKEMQIKLVILGDGEDKDYLMTYAKKLKCQDSIEFLRFCKNPFPYIKNALFSVLTSHSEGFALVIPESLCLKTPVISVDCDAGPKEIITHGYNGLLVENYNVTALAKAFNTFIEDKSIYNKCKSNSKQSVEKFSIENITEAWKNLLS